MYIQSLKTLSSNWSDARIHAFIVSVLRAGSRRWPHKYETLAEAKTTKKINPKTGRVAQHYACAVCKEDFPQKEMDVDHILPVVDPKKGFKNWDTYIERLFCKKENLQAICRPCHKIKTAKEKQHRSKAKH